MTPNLATVVFVSLGLLTPTHPSATPTAKDLAVETVSLVNLLATPASYDGKRVRVVGVAQVEFEWNLLYMGVEDFRRRVLPNAVGLSFGAAGPSEQQRSRTGDYVVVIGIFKMRRHGTRERQVGTIGSISAFEKWELPPQSPLPSRRP